MEGMESRVLVDGVSDSGNAFFETGATANETLLVSEVQLLLAEKRTSLATLRTGIAVFVLPLSVLSILIATSRFYELFRVLHFIIPLLLLNSALVFLGAYLILRSILKMRHEEKLIRRIKEANTRIAEFID